jgi:hypothetical protein
MQYQFSRVRRVAASNPEREMTSRPPLTHHAPRRVLAAGLEVACPLGFDVPGAGVSGTSAARRRRMPQPVLPARRSGRIAS